MPSTSFIHPHVPPSSPLRDLFYPANCNLLFSRGRPSRRGVISLADATTRVVGILRGLRLEGDVVAGLVILLVIPVVSVRRRVGRARVLRHLLRRLLARGSVGREGAGAGVLLVLVARCVLWRGHPARAVNGRLAARAAAARVDAREHGDQGDEEDDDHAGEHPAAPPVPRRVLVAAAAAVVVPAVAVAAAEGGVSTRADRSV